LKRSTIVSLVGCLSDVDDFCLMFVRRLSDVENACLMSNRVCPMSNRVCLMSNRVCLMFVGCQSREKYNEVPPNNLGIYLRGVIWEKGPPEILSTDRRVPGGPVVVAIFYTLRKLTHERATLQHC